MNVRDETRHDIHKSAALRYALLCIVTRLFSAVHFHITGPKLTFNSYIIEERRKYVKRPNRPYVTAKYKEYFEKDQYTTI